MIAGIPLRPIKGRHSTRLVAISSNGRRISWLAWPRALVLTILFATEAFGTEIAWAGSLQKGNRALSVNEQNPRYFADADGKPIYLAGSHTWNNLVDMDAVRPPHSFDFDAYLDFLAAHRHNYIRLWTWEVPNPRSERYERRIYVAPQAWRRTGPGLAVDGLPRFDLEVLDPEYFDRLRIRARAAVERGFYVSVMLFEGWAVQFAPGSSSHPFRAVNNVNGVDCGSDPRSIHTLEHQHINEIQKRYVRAVVDAVNDLAPLFFEICNECGGYSTAWQHTMMEFVRSYEKTKLNQHPVGMTFQWENGANETLFESAADWVAPGASSGHYVTDPEAATGDKVVITDTDHLLGSEATDRELIWKSFTRGLNTALMDRYVAPDSVSDKLLPKVVYARVAMGDTAIVARHLDLRVTKPDTDIASTGYALAAEDELIVYSPSKHELSVDLSRMPDGLVVEWFDPESGKLISGRDVDGGADRVFSPPCTEDCVLYVRADQAARRSLTTLAPEFDAIRHAGFEYVDGATRLRLSVRSWLKRTFLARGVFGAGLAIIVGFATGMTGAALLLIGSCWVWKQKRE